MTGGFIIRRYDLKTLGCAKMAAISSIISFTLFIPAVLFTCGNAPIAGVTVDYPGNISKVSYDHSKTTSKSVLCRHTIQKPVKTS